MENTWSIIATIIGVIATVLAGVWFIISKAFNTGRIVHRMDELDNQTSARGKEIERIGDDLKAVRSDISVVRSLLDRHDREIESMKEGILSVSKDVLTIKSLLTLKHKDAHKVFSAKCSPRRLNEVGSRLFSEIKGKQFLETHKDLLFAKIDLARPQTALDVENAALEACTASSNDVIFNELKNFVYNAPSYPVTGEDGNPRTYDLSLPDVCFVLSLPLRDMYLDAHPEISR